MTQSIRIAAASSFLVLALGFASCGGGDDNGNEQPEVDSSDLPQAGEVTETIEQLGASAAAAAEEGVFVQDGPGVENLIEGEYIDEDAFCSAVSEAVASGDETDWFEARDAFTQEWTGNDQLAKDEGEHVFYDLALGLADMSDSCPDPPHALQADLPR